MSLIDRLLRRKKESDIKETLIEVHHPLDILDEEGSDKDEDRTVDVTEETIGVVAEDPGMEYEVVEREILPAKIICPDCGGITLEGLDFCDKCGGELQ